MTESLKEIIRVLQLTSPTEEQGALASDTGGLRSGLPGGILPGTLAAKVFEAKTLLAKTGEQNLRSCKLLLALSEEHSIFVNSAMTVAGIFQGNYISRISWYRPNL